VVGSGSDDLCGPAKVYDARSHFSSTMKKNR
jgi:hypothetical protein